MNSIKLLISGLILFLLVSINPSIGQDQSLIDVNNGDEFTFILDKYHESFEDDFGDNDYSRDELSFYGSDGSSTKKIIVKPGEEFTFKIVNSTAVDRSINSQGTLYFNPWAIYIEIIGPNGTILTDELEIGIASFLSFTNWTGYKTEFEQFISEFEEDIDNDPLTSGTFTLIDTQDEFGFIWEETFAGDSSSNIAQSFYREIIYEKSTGMINFIDFKSNSDSTDENVIYKSETLYKIFRKGYRDGDANNPLPAFTTQIAFFSLLFLVYQKRISKK